jgi:histidyl-tRNA synthetase
MSTISAPKGVSEYFAPNSHNFEKVISTLSEIAKGSGYHPIELPIFEDTDLFKRGVGESTDVVTKEMYTFEDRGGRSLTLRPEGTAGVMRSVIEHNLDKGQLPVKCYYKGPFFRAERPQKGRYRQFYQFGIEAIGYRDPEIDFEVISIADRAFKKLGLQEFRLEITSLGDKDSRAAHRVELIKFIDSLDLDEESKARAAINPLRLFDDKREEIIAKMAKAPLLLDYLSDAESANFARVQEFLRQAKIEFVVNPRMVRGLDYYTGTTFEFVHPLLGSQSGIGGGGRYDGLMSQLGGDEHSGIGFGLGIDRILLALEAEEVAANDDHALDIFLVSMSSESKAYAAALLNTLRGAGIFADMAYGDRSLKGSMKAADKSGARYVVVIGDEEIANQGCKVKRMHDGQEVSIKLSGLDIEPLLAAIGGHEAGEK